MKERFTTILFGLLLMILILLTACSNNESKIIPSQESIDSIKTKLSMFAKYLPIEGGIGMIITNVDYDDATYTIKYKYQYTIPGAERPTEKQVDEAKKLAVIVIKNQPEGKKLLEQGFVFRYDYYSIDDEYLFTQEITVEDLPID